MTSGPPSGASLLPLPPSSKSTGRAGEAESGDSRNFSITLERGAADRSVVSYAMRYGEWTPGTSGYSAGAADASGGSAARDNPRAARPHSRTRRDRSEAA